MHGYKWPINCTRTRTAGGAAAARGGKRAAVVSPEAGYSLTEEQLMAKRAAYLPSALATKHGHSACSELLAAAGV